MPTSDQIAIIAAAIAFGSAVVSVLAIYFPWKNTHDSEVFKEAVLALERAFRSLMLNAHSDGQPAPDRLNWLTAARHIESYKSLRNSLKTSLYKRLCQEHEEHWRHEFYLKILKNRMYQISYFESGPIEPRSAIVVYGFAAWPNTKQDLIDMLDLEKLFQESDLLKGNHGLQQYLAKFPEFGGDGNK
ncbi:MAG: hypothetical protein K2Y31_09915 [Burkholderiales bacterium]|nr:hypothetical protein [Burkholderiales bacterium]